MRSPLPAESETHGLDEGRGGGGGAIHLGGVQRTLTQDGLDHAVFQNLQGTGADKIVCLQGVSVAYEVLPRRTEGGLDVQGEGAQAPSAGALEHGQLQNVFVQVHGDVGSQLIREVMQQLRKRREKQE